MLFINLAIGASVILVRDRAKQVVVSILMTFKAKRKHGWWVGWLV